MAKQAYDDQSQADAKIGVVLHLGKNHDSENNYPGQNYKKPTIFN